MNNSTKWINALGSVLIKDVNIEISKKPNTVKICLKCNQKFIYEREDEIEKFYRQFASLKKGNLDLCFNCDDDYTLKNIN